MVIKLEFKKVGNHWYPCLQHDNVCDLKLETKTEKLLSKIDFINMGTVTIYIKQSHSIIGTKGIVQFSENSMEQLEYKESDYRVFFYIDDYQYSISKSLFGLLEKEFGLDFHNNYYQLELW